MSDENEGIDNEISHIDGNNTSEERNNAEIDAKPNESKLADFKIKLDVHPDCDVNDVKECIEVNFHGALKENAISDDENKYIRIESPKDETSDSREKVDTIKVIDTLEVKKALETSDPVVNPKNYYNWDDLCFKNSIHSKVMIRCIGIVKTNN